MKKKLIILFGFLFLIGLSACSNGQRVGTSKEALIVGIDDSFVPMGFQTSAGKLTGFDVAVAQKVGQVIHRKLIFQTIDWSMKETELRNGTIDLIWNGYTKTPERAAKVYFSHPYLRNQQVVVVKKADHITTLKQLQNKTVGVQSGSTGYEDLMQQPQILKNIIRNQTPVQYDNIQNGMLDLKAGRIQGFLIDRVFAEYYLKHDRQQHQYQILVTPYRSENFAVGMRKHDYALQKQIDQALKHLKDTGQLKSLSEQWFGKDITQ
ncbi:amino acid ABC transporter substrate-binding protein [Bombilactobacillus bombi]|uniref:amino acid ABC transporter substrate-binding protein n=1 Tax=Bombilactobacillus bombi TaxID=1303590 RepID=UPI0015E60E24|nr:amino acid ABC transporter substrate-binding protein [Bombilactobacillus bombi]MBA1434362.1 amino acid ABC transporter substrate-binding protein [Bombilactobacillus bombi]